MSWVQLILQVSEGQGGGGGHFLPSLISGSFDWEVKSVAAIVIEMRGGCDKTVD